MIEVLFGESEAGAMKAAKSQKIVTRNCNGPTSFLGKLHEKPEEEIHWIFGNSDEVICLGFQFDLGDIQQDIVSPYRKKLIYSMLQRETHETDLESSQELMQLCSIYEKELNRLRVYIEEGESIRIWYSRRPYSICGLYFLCNWLKSCENEILVVELPEYSICENKMVSYQNWGEVSAEEFASFLPVQRKLTAMEQRSYSQIWNDLVEDNSALRVMINGKIVGAPDDFYDFLIWKKLDANPIKQGRLIGDILGRYQLSIGDWWYAKRIEALIEKGKIEIVEDSRNPYARVLRRKL